MREKLRNKNNPVYQTGSPAQHRMDCQSGRYYHACTLRHLQRSRACEVATALDRNLRTRTPPHLMKAPGWQLRLRTTRAERGKKSSSHNAPMQYSATRRNAERSKGHLIALD